MHDEGSQKRYEVGYLYRDESNYKFRGQFVVRGYLDTDALRPFLFDGQWFVPERLGLPALRPPEARPGDHLLHEFEEVTPYAGPDPGVPADALARRIRAIGPGAAWFGGG